MLLYGASTLLFALALLLLVAQHEDQSRLALGVASVVGMAAAARTLLTFDGSKK